MGDIFYKILEGTIPCDKVLENEHLIAFKDIAPQAPVHILIVPKKKIACVQELSEEDGALLGEIFKAARYLAEEYGIAEGYRLLTNNGPKAGQTIFQLHFHLLGGRELGKLG